MSILWTDTETRSTVDLKSRGAYLYAEESEPLMVQYALDDNSVKVWSPALGELMPTDLHEYFSDPTIELAFHGVEFDRTNMLAWGWGEKYDLSAHRFLCTQTWARTCKLPAGLADLCVALQVPLEMQKKDGDALIKRFCVPQLNGTYIEAAESPVEWGRFVGYGIADIEAMRECARRMPAVFNGIERELFARTLEMNMRGIRVDRELASSAMLLSERVKKRLKAEGATTAKELATETGIGDTETLNVSSQLAIQTLLREHGVVLPDTRANTIEKFLDASAADAIPPLLRSLLSTRLKVNKASVAKYSAVLKGVSKDDRLRGLITFYGAGTGRDSGKRFQPQNLARPALLGPNLSMEQAVSYIKAGTPELFFDSPMQLLSDAVRGVLVPSKGNKFCVADLASIEGRVLPWLAGEKWMVDYFHDLDAGKVHYDGYQLAYATAFGVDPATVTKAQRTLGKPIDLACGFGGSVGALLTFAAVYNIDIEYMANAAKQAADPYLWHECFKSYDWFLEKKLTLDLPKEIWVGCYYIIKSWRNNRAGTVALWAQLEAAFKNAIAHPGVAFPAAHNTTIYNSNGWVFITLPSGRSLVYPYARLEVRGDREQIAFNGINPITKRWSTIFTYGGKLAENVTQGVARDCFFWNIPGMESCGYQPVGRVHDEAITETPDTPEYSGERLAQIMSTNQTWNADLPLKAVGEDLYRYQK